MEQKLIIDWTQMPTYNTIMSIAVGAALITLSRFILALHKKTISHTEAWSISFAVSGVILLITGAHMTLTWPLAKYFPFDNIIFGETSLGFAVLLLAASLYLWKKGTSFVSESNPAEVFSKMTNPVSIFIFGLGLALIAIACAGISFQLFAAPPEEPISGKFAKYPWVEAIAMSGLFGLVGLGALLFPLGMKKFSSSTSLNSLQKAMIYAWTISGYSFLFFGALNFYTHIGLIINTMN
ncbi:hypothetical protein BDW_03075 [Bdellovibrio bacteriovorus W]|nr:hypothetical protein BDW_03075 [Bdellovibrio bacteriovorus W]